MIDCIRTHHYIPTVINFETAKFWHNLIHDPILSNINFNQVSHLIWRCYDRHTITCQIYKIMIIMNEMYKFGIWPYGGHNIVMLDRKHIPHFNDFFIQLDQQNLPICLEARRYCVSIRLCDIRWIFRCSDWRNNSVLLDKLICIRDLSNVQSLHSLQNLQP